MATGCDGRSLDPFGVPLGVRMRNRKLCNTRSDPFGSVLGCSLRRPRPIFSMVTGTSTRVQIPSFLHILYESIIGNHNIVHFIGIGSYGTEVVPKISMECCIK